MLTSASVLRARTVSYVHVILRSWGAACNHPSNDATPYSSSALLAGSQVSDTKVDLDTLVHFNNSCCSQEDSTVSWRHCKWLLVDVEEDNSNSVSNRETSSCIGA